jgi:hypothetical protein
VSTGSSGDAVLSLSGGGQIHLIGTAPSAIGAEWFV